MKLPNGVTLTEGSGSKGSEILRCAQEDNAGLPERSEESGSKGSEILRCAQDGRAVHPAALWATQAHGRLHLTPFGTGIQAQ